jgi:microcystin-dependent protein
MAKSRRSYKGAPVSNTLASGGLAAGATSISLATAMSGWPTTSEPFFVVVNPGTANEEKICVIYNNTTTLTVVDEDVTSAWSASENGRGVDDTTDRTHAGGATIYPVFTALEANQANLLVSTYANQGGIVYQGSSNPTQLAIGTASHVLKVNSGATAPEWGQVGTDGIADSAITSGKILDGAIVNADINASAAIALSKLATGALPTAITVASANLVDLTIDTADIKDSAVTLAKLATAVANALVPVGTITAYAGATAPTGWLLCDGTSTSGYTALAALVGATTPDFKGRFLIGDNASLTLLGTGGSTTIATTNLPAHSHANTASASTTVAILDPGHTHASTALGYEIGSSQFSPSGSASNWGYDVGTAAATTGISATAATSVTMTNAETGGAQAYYQPYGVVNYIIKHD